jgi:hypothetical protein
MASFGTRDSVELAEFFEKLFAWTNYAPPKENDQIRAWLTCSFPGLTPSGVQEGDRGHITAQQFGWVLRWFAPLSRTPKILARVRSVWENEFFWGHLPAATAISYLSDQPDGTFLIRFSSKEPTFGQYTLSRVIGKETVHTRLEYATQTRRYTYADAKGLSSSPMTASDSRPCKSLTSLVRHTAGLVRPLAEVSSIGRLRPLALDVLYLSAEQISTRLKAARVHRSRQARSGSRFHLPFDFPVPQLNQIHPQRNCR